MTAKEKKILAQDLIMEQLAIIGYGERFEEFASNFDSDEEACEVLMKQMNRVAKIMGYKSAWFS